MIAFLSLVATTEAQSYGAQGQQPIGQFRGLPGGSEIEDYGAPAPGSAVPMNPEYDHVPGSHFHGKPMAPAPGAYPSLQAQFPEPALEAYPSQEAQIAEPAPEGTPSSVGPYGPGCKNPCQGWSVWNQCGPIPCQDADRRRINQQWQQHYNNNPIPQIQPTPAELAEGVELNRIENELAVQKILSDDLFKTEAEAARQRIEANAQIEIVKVDKMEELAETISDISALNKVENSLDRVIDEEAQNREEQIIEALPQAQQTQPDLFMGRFPAVSNPSVLPQAQQQQQFEYRTNANGANVPFQIGAPQQAQDAFLGFQETQPLYPNAAMQGSPALPYAPLGNQAFQQQSQSSQQFQAQPLTASAPVQNLYPYGTNADPALDYGAMANRGFQTQFI